MIIQSTTSAKQITNKRIIAFMTRKMIYWTPVKYGQKYYVMTFQYNIYEVDAPIKGEVKQ